MRVYSHHTFIHDLNKRKTIRSICLYLFLCLALTIFGYSYMQYVRIWCISELNYKQFWTNERIAQFKTVSPLFLSHIIHSTIHSIHGKLYEIQKWFYLYIDAQNRINIDWSIGNWDTNGIHLVSYVFDAIQ